jgi:hypothetical protein
MRVLNKLSIIGLLLSAVFYLGACGGSSSSSNSTAVNPTGSGSVTLDPITKKLSGSFMVTNITGTAAHIHDGAVGVAGGVVVALTESTPGTWSVPATAIALTDAQIAKLQAGGLYVNVHTTLNPSGEIRGQLVVSSTNANLFNATITLAQEVPTPTAPAGSAY